MKPNERPGAGVGSPPRPRHPKYNNTRPYSANSTARLGVANRTTRQPTRIILTPIKYGGRHWGWLARCGGRVCWGESKGHAHWRMKRALVGE